MYQTSKILASTFLKFLGIVFATCLVHWTLVNAYTYYCAPLSMFGVFHTLISLGSPFCQFINIFQLEVAKHYITIWTVAGVGLISWFIAKTNLKNKQ